MTQPTAGASPSLAIDQWDMINTFMKDDYLAPLRASVEAKCEDDLTFTERCVDFVMPGAKLNPYGGLQTSGVDLLCRVAGRMIPSADVIFPKVTLPDGSERLCATPTEFLEALGDHWRAFEQAAKNKMSDIESLWKDVYEPCSGAPKKLHDVSTAWSEIGSAIQPIPQDVAGVQQISGWQGDGADAYARVVPHQKEATTSTGTMVTDSSSVLGNASRGLQGLYLSIAAQLQQAKQLIDNYEVEGIASGWEWLVNLAPRARYATLVLEDTLTYLRDKLPKSETYWALNVDTASSTLSDHETLDEKIFVNGAWPPSEGDKLGDIHPGGDPTQTPATADPSATQPPASTPPVDPAASAPVQGQDVSGNRTFKADDALPGSISIEL